MQPSFTGTIRAMFDTIAPTYDLLNRINSLGMDQCWRRDLVRRVSLEKPSLILDLAAGTGDLTLMLAHSNPDATIVASDISLGMLEVAVRKARKAGLPQVKIAVADAMELPFEDEHFDAVTCGFGVRNFESLHRGYEEMFRVLKPGGMIAILELSEPINPIYRTFYELHTEINLPLFSTFIGQNAAEYRYLTRSIKATPQRKKMLQLIEMAGFINTYQYTYTPGACTIYVGYKPRTFVEKIDG